MKFIAFCASAILSLSLVSCGGYDNDKVKTINESSDLTTEQQEYGLKLYLDFQEEAISELKENISNVKEDFLKNKAASAAKKALREAEYDNTEAYKAVKDKITENNQEIEKLHKEYTKALEEAAKELGY